MASTSRKDALNVEQMETKDEMIDDVQVDVKDLVPPIKGSGKLKWASLSFLEVLLSRMIGKEHGPALRR